MKYYVRSRFYDNGKVETRIFLESEVVGLDTSNEELADFNEYWYTFPSYEQALLFIKIEGDIAEGDIAE